LNTGIPGTGLYNRQKIERGAKHKNRFSAFDQPTPLPRMHQYPEIGAIRTEKAEATTTEGLQELRKMLLDCYSLRTELTLAMQLAKKKLKRASILFIISRMLVLGFFIHWFRVYRDRKKSNLGDLQEQLNGCFVEIDMNVEKAIHEKYTSLISCYKALLTCNKMWDVTSSRSVDQVATRSAASVAISRRIVRFGFQSIDIIRSQYEAL